MMKRKAGRPPNPLRAAARAAGHRFYSCYDPCRLCGTTERYTVNGGCVACAIARGNMRYLDIASNKRQRLAYNRQQREAKHRRMGATDR